MYELKFEDKHNQILSTIELKKLENIYQKSTKQEKVDKFILEDVFKKAGYGINILKPIPEKNDFKFIYTSPIFWDYFHPNLHQYNKGRYFKQVYNKIENIKINIPKFIQKDSRHDEIIKLYHNNKLIKIWTISKIIQNNLLYLLIEDKTATYFEKEKDDKIFKYSPFPKMNLNKEGEVIKLNKALTDFLGYTVQDLNNKNLDDYVTTFNSPNQHIKGFMDAVNQIFNKKIDYVDSKLGLISKKGDYKWVSCHIRLINDNLVQVSLQDLSELKQTQQETLNLTRYLSGIKEASKTAFYIKDNNHFQWTDEIFTILELDPSQQENNSHKNILKEYIPPETQKNVDKSFKRLTKTQPVTIEHEIITAKGNTKYIRAIIKLQQENKKLVEVGFIQDITNEKLAQKKALELTENIKEIQEFSKIFLATLKDGEYYYTPEVYNILELDPEKVSPNELTNYLIPEDREELLKLFKNVSVENPTFNLNYRILTSNGDLKYVSCYSKGVFDYKGELLKMVSFQQDVTEEVVAKEKLLTINNIMSLIQGLTKIFLGEYKNGQFNFTSELYNILGVTEENFKNNYSIKDFVLDEDKKLVEKFLKELTPEKTYNHLTFRVKNTNNEIRYIYTCSRAEFDEDEELNSIVGFFQDVTEETLLKQDAFELQDNISSIQSFSKIFLCTVIGDEFVYTPEVYNILDISPKEYSDKDLINFIDPEYKEYLFNQIQSINYDNPSCRFSYNLHTPNGVLKIFRAFVSGKFDENHELIKIIAFVQEVTDEILAHKEALELQSNMEHIQSFSKIFIGVIENGQYHYTGDVYGILEASPEEYSENDLEKLIIPEDMRMLQEYMDNLSVENSNYQLTYRLITPKGNLKYLKSLTTAEFNEDGELIKIIGFVQDVTDETLRNQEALELQENIHDIQDFSKIFISINENGNVSYTDEVFNILEISDDNFDENELVNFIVPEDLKVFLSKMDGICLENPNFHLLYRLITPKGNLKYLKTFKIGKFNDDGELIKIVGFVQDVTEETLIHNETIRLRDNFEVIQYSSKVFIAELENGKYSWTNEINNIFGINKEEYSQEVNLITEFILPEDKHLFDESMILTINNPNKQTIVRIKRPDEDIRYLNINNRGKFDKDNNLIRTVSFIRDITEETLANKESMRLTENFALIESTSKSFICEFEDGKYSFTGEVYNILEVSPDEFPDDVNVVKDFIVPEDQHLWSDALKDLNPDNSEFSLTYRLRNRSGELIYINSQNKAVFDNDGDLVRLVGFIQDVTDEKLANIKANRLQENFALMEETGKIFIAELNEGKYHFSMSLYDFLGIKSENQDNNYPIIKKFVLPEDLPIYNHLMDISSDNPVLHGTFRVKTTKGEIKYLNTTNKAKFDNEGNLVRIVGLLQDVTEETLKNQEALELKENLDDTLGNNKMFIGTYENGKFSYTDSIYDIAEGKKGEFNPDDLLERIYPEDLKYIYQGYDNITIDNPSFKFTYRVTTLKNNLKYLRFFATGRFNDDGELIKIINIVQDVTEETLAQREALQLQKDLNVVQSSSKIVFVHSRKGKYVFTDEIYNILEIDANDFPDGFDVINYFTILSDKDKVYEKTNKLTLDNPTCRNIATVKTPNGNVKVLEGFMTGEFDSDGNLIGHIGLVQEITDRVKREKELEQLSEDRKILLQEVHHRVKNNLQIILSFLSLESRYNKDNPEYVIDQTKNRISTMALIHEEIYQSPSVSNINLEHFLTKSMKNLFNLYTNGRISLFFNIEPIEVDIDKGIPLGLLVNEVALNTIKYAFPGNGSGKFNISLHQVDGDLILKVWDNGIGLPKGVDLFNSSSLGFIIINNLTKQLEGELSVLEEAPGFGIQLVFKA